MTQATRLSVNDLAERCTEETRKFTRHEADDPQFCFELLRRALLNDAPDAFAQVYRIYEPLVRRWIYNYSRFIQTGEDVEYFANAALSKFYFALRGPKFEQFDSLAKVLLYLKRCIHTEIAQHIRSQSMLDAIPLPEDDLTPAPKTESDLAARELWTRITVLLSDEKDRKLARCLFIEDMKPAQVFSSYPDDWDSPRDVSVARQRITRILRRDATICSWAGIETSNE